MADKATLLTDRLLKALNLNVSLIGESYTGDCDVDMTASTTTIVSDDLKDFGDDYFNTGWVMKILHNVNNDGNPPEGEIRNITNYVSVTGTFTTAAFSANVEENDVVLVGKQIDFEISSFTLPVNPAAGSLASFISSGNGSTALGTQLGIDVSILDAIGHDGVARLDSGIDGLLADGLINGTGTVLPGDKSLYDEMGGTDSNSYPIATDTKFLKSVALTGEVAYSIGDILKVSATEKLKNFIAKTGGTEIAATKAIADALGHDGTNDLNTGIMAQLQDYVTDDTDSIYGRFGAFTGPVGGTEQDDNVKASLDILHTKTLTGKGIIQIFEKSITSAADAGNVLIGTITDQPCLIKSVIVHADTAVQTDLTSAGVYGGTNIATHTITFLSAAQAAKANIDAVDEQVAWTGAARLAATKVLAIELLGTGATAVDLTIIVEYMATVDGGYIV